MPRPAVVAGALPIKRYNVELTFTEPLLGSTPADKDLYVNYIASKKAKLELRTASAEDKQAMTDRLAEEELRLLPTEEEASKGTTVFRQKDGKLIFLDYVARGFLKEASRVVGGITASASKITKFCFIEQRYIALLRDGQPITKADEVKVRPLRATGPQGVRVTIASSETLNPPCHCNFSISVLPGGQQEIDLAALQAWFAYGQFSGLGQWRNASYGRYTAVVTPLPDGPLFGINRS